ncbi:MAG: hypothetical protein ABC596_08865 [Candidatus Methanosuratincola petrocarbonis]
MSGGKAGALDNRPFSSPASEVISMLKYFWQEHRYQVLMVLGGVVEIDQRLKYALFSGDPELENQAIEVLGMLISMSPASSSIIVYLMRAFGSAMSNIHVQVQQPIAVKRPLQTGDDMDTR